MVSLRDYIERIFEERQKQLEVAFRGQQDALTLARGTLELRLEKLNELRQEVTSDRGNYVTKDKYDADMSARNAVIAELKSKIDHAEGAVNLARFLGASGVAALILEIARIAGAVH